MEIRQSILVLLLPSYKSDPDGRGTITLLWSCTLTFGLCIWTAIHPDVVPWPGFWNKVVYKLAWMLCAILLPEFIVFCAACQLMQARRIHQHWNEAFKNFPAVKSWLGMSGAFFVVMGGFVIQEDPKPRTASPPQEAGSNDSSSSSEEKGSTITICPIGFLKLLEKKIVHEGIQKGNLTEAQFASRNIEDKGKADGIAKFLVMIQILWMVVQCIGRKITGLPVVLLEIHVLTQIFFSTISYLCWWNKPLDVGEPIALPLDRARLSAAGIVAPKGFSPYPLLKTESTRQGTLTRMLYRMGDDFVGSFLVINKDDNFEISATILGMISGGIHAAAWNTHFPTGIEQLLWRVAFIGIGSMPLLLCFLVYGLGGEVYVQWIFYELQFIDKPIHHVVAAILHNAVERRKPDGVPDEKNLGFSERIPLWARYLHLGVIWLIAFGYLFSVLYLTVESFVSVRSLPEGAYATLEWSDFFPHL
ncbi:hypothetical protein BDW42DRAFT_201052 [Aspergillus taichungensis]|uniref:Uncharacterized protein n=1 Tax=Aspergillus taichungensis TaxID=482145 RepID=A0A2J5HUE3_9EURO|nr:hypothetical protein BDW42DRAFT_201052 [Aspergillus taichungensis]